MDPGRLAARRQKAAENRVGGKCTNCGGPTPWRSDGHFDRTCSAKCLKVRRLWGRIERRLQRRKCTNCGGPTPFSKNGMPRRTCSPECLKARYGRSAEVHRGKRWHILEGKRVEIEQYQCEYCPRKFPRRRNNSANRFCSRLCAFRQMRKEGRHVFQLRAQIKRFEKMSETAQA